MKTWIALLRGINVGGKNLLPMKKLVSYLEAGGAKNVTTYVQSGNVVFQTNKKSIATLSKRVGDEIEQHHGFKPDIIAFDVSVLEKAMSTNPFHAAEAEPSRLFLGFLAFKPKKPDLEKLASLKHASEQFRLIDRVFYLHAPEGIGKSKLGARAEKALGVPMTVRNWKSVCKLYELASDR